MDRYSITLDFDPTISGENKTVDEFLGDVYTDAGPVEVRLIKRVGPTGASVIDVIGTAPNLLAWLLSEYEPKLDRALELLSYDGNTAREKV